VHGEDDDLREILHRTYGRSSALYPRKSRARPSGDSSLTDLRNLDHDGSYPGVLLWEQAGIFGTGHGQPCSTNNATDGTFSYI
jgi:hypothetical protein